MAGTIPTFFEGVSRLARIKAIRHPLLKVFSGDMCG
jgi:hypothetical protein